MPDPTNPNVPVAPAPAASTVDPMREAQMRRLAMAMMQGGPTAPMQPSGSPQTLFGGLSQGLGQGANMARQQQIQQAIGLPSPWDRLKQMFGGSTPPAPTVPPVA